MNRREKEKVKAKRNSTREFAEDQDRNYKPYALPKGVKMFTFPEEGDYDVDIVPYRAGEQNAKADPGYTIWHCIYFKHDLPSVAGNTATYVCPAQTWTEDCPACEWIGKTRPEKETYDQIKPKKRILMNFKIVGEKEIAPYECAFYGFQGTGFGEMLQKEIQRLLKKGKEPNLDALEAEEGGMSLRLKVREGEFKSKKFLFIHDVSLVEREEDLTDADVKRAVCLDKMLIKPSADDLEAALGNKSKKKVRDVERNGSVDEADELEDEETDDEGDSDLESDVDEDSDDEDEEPVHAKKKHKKAAVEDDESPLESDSDEDNDETDPELEDDEDSDVDDLDESDDLDDDDDIPPPKKKGGTKVKGKRQ